MSADAIIHARASPSAEHALQCAISPQKINTFRKSIDRCVTPDFFKSTGYAVNATAAGEFREYQRRSLNLTDRDFISHVLCASGAGQFDFKERAPSILPPRTRIRSLPLMAPASGHLRHRTRMGIITRPRIVRQNWRASPPDTPPVYQVGVSRHWRNIIRSRSNGAAETQ